MRAEPHLSAPSSRPDATIVAADTFTLVKIPPAAELAGLVLDIALYRETSRRPFRQVETASLVVPLLIGFTDPFEIALGRQPSAADGFHSFTSGLTLKPVNIRSDGACSCLEVTLTPLGARRFFGLPMHELSEQMVALDQLGDASLTRLRQRLGEEASWDRRLAIAEAFLLSRMRRAPASDPAVASAYDRIVASGGRIPVARLAQHLGWSRKHLAARFREEIGLPPKAVARIARFGRAQSLAASGRCTGWADVAAACGYADQAHLTREFREFSGSTPTGWLGTESPR